MSPRPFIDGLIADVRAAIEDDVALDRSMTADEAASVAMDAAERVLRENAGSWAPAP